MLLARTESHDKPKCIGHLVGTTQCTAGLDELHKSINITGLPNELLTTADNQFNFLELNYDYSSQISQDASI